MKTIAAIGKYMNITDKYFRLYLRNQLLPFGLNAAEGTVLLTLYEFHGSSQEASSSQSPTQDFLIQNLHYDKGVMTRTMKSLESKGYISRVPNPKDSRSSIFALTSQGLSFKETLIQILSQWANLLLQDVSKDSLPVLEEILSIMAKNAAATCQPQNQTTSSPDTTKEDSIS